ncbi:MAG: sigma 54-interacting transcriptional regulator [Bdellovibrionota bacterium]
MREDVLIILNEREPLKQQMANALEDNLEQRSFACGRLRPAAQLAQIIVERMPRVLVLDYLLGDEGTALDVLTQLEDLDSQALVRTIVWTDEPSVSVAVTAMKLGAYDYIELGASKDLEKLVKSIEECLTASHREDAAQRPRPSHRESAEQPIFQSPAAKFCFAEAQSVAKQSPEVVVLLGESGCGRNTVARTIHQQREGAGSIIELDLENWPGTAEHIFGSPASRQIVPYLSAAGTVVVDHAEFDCSGELLDYFVESHDRIWPLPEHRGFPVLIVGTSSDDTAQLWRRMANARLIRVPSLHERREDILPLLQRFILDARQFGPINRWEITPALIDEIAKAYWPGNIKQLRAAVIDVLTTEIDAQRLRLSDARTADDDQTVLLRGLLEGKSRYETYAVVSQTVPSPILARQALEIAAGNMRVAAAQLGVGVPQLRAAMSAANSRALDTRVEGGVEL